MIWNNNNNSAYIKPEDITEDNAAEVMRNHIFMASMNPNMDNYGLCLAKAMKLGAEALEREARRRANDREEKALPGIE